MSGSTERVFLSPPDVGNLERRLLYDAFDSNWIAPPGSRADAFEREFAEVVRIAHFDGEFQLRGLNGEVATMPDGPRVAHRSEVERGERFEFGANWARFLRVLDEGRIGQSEAALRDWLGDLAGRTFLDVGSGSGLSSLAAMRLGAARVHSLDYDPRSVACTAELRRRYFDGDGRWTIEEASALDRPHLASLGRFDVVYSWGVLHHTGAMWDALGNMAPLVAPGGRLLVAIYNDQGTMSRWWKLLKRTYNRLPRPLKAPYAIAVMGPREVAMALTFLAMGRPLSYARSWGDRSRGMNGWYDRIDWIGGYPFEVARPEQIRDFFQGRRFQPVRSKTCGRRLGCNEFLFSKPDDQGPIP